MLLLDDVNTSNECFDKKTFRTLMKRQRNSLGEAYRLRASQAICHTVCEMTAFKSACVLLAYASFGSEVATYDVVERAYREGKTVCFPRCVSEGRMVWHRVASLSELEQGYAGILEPPAFLENYYPRGNEAVLVPGLTYDTGGYRLGYGGGFYDRFLHRWKIFRANIPLIERCGGALGLCYEEMICEKLAYVDELDERVSTVVTEACRYTPRNEQ